MEKFELQQPISQLFNVLKSQYFCMWNFIQIGCSEQSTISLVTSSLCVTLIYHIPGFNFLFLIPSTIARKDRSSKSLWINRKRKKDEQKNIHLGGEGQTEWRQPGVSILCGTFYILSHSGWVWTFDAKARWRSQVNLAGKITERGVTVVVFCAVWSFWPEFMGRLLRRSHWTPRLESPTLVFVLFLSGNSWGETLQMDGKVMEILFYVLGKC